MDFAQRLSKLMKTKRLGVRELAKAIGVSPSTISEWTGGRQPGASPELVKLASILGVSLEELITGKSSERESAKAIIQSITESFTTIHTGIYRVKIEKMSDEEK